MPVDPSHRLSRQITSESEIEIKRARGELSCAECRRLKLKCDRKIPCGSCTRRGCQSICPNGSLASGQGTRSILANTPRLHVKIAEMGQRIRQLEDALTIFQSGVSSETHPLLREELLSVKLGLSQDQKSELEETIHDNFADSIDALGTMTIGERGQIKYFGRTVGSEALLLAGSDMDSSMLITDKHQSPFLPHEIRQLSNTFPFGLEGNHERYLDILFDYLPSQPRAWSLCEAYMEHVAWLFRPIKRDEIIDDYFTPTYRLLRERRARMTPGPHTTPPHELAVLYLLFALGALVDLTLEPYNAESETYYHLARACLSLRSVFESPEISSVYAVLLMAKYHGLGGKNFTIDGSWSLLSLGCKLAQGIGLHRDSARSDMDPKTLQRRRAFFWDLFSHELFYSLATGRPPAILLPYVDCEFPIDDEAIMDKNGRTMKGYYQWKYEFTKEILSAIVALTLTAEPPSYQIILDLDRKVREKTVPPHLNVFLNPEDEHFTPSAYMRGCVLGQYRTVGGYRSIFCFFAQAMLDYPANPLRSPYAPSFLAAYRCASGVIKSNLNHFERFPDLCCRWWNIWAHLFSAAVIMGTIVTRSPASSMSPSAFIELGLACDLFEKGATRNHRARDSLVILRKLREKAFTIYTHFRSGDNTPNTVLSVGMPDYGEDELALFGGQTRALVSKLVKKAENPHLNSGASESQSQKEVSPDVHPSLVEYLSNIPPAHYSGTQVAFPTEIDDYTSQSQGASVDITPQQNAPVEAYWPSRASFTTFAETRDYTPSLSDANSMINHSQGNLFDLGMMMTGDSGMDEQWMSFMRDSVLLDDSSTGSTLYQYHGFPGHP